MAGSTIKTWKTRFRGKISIAILISLHGDFKDKVRMIALSLGAFGILFALLGLAGNFIFYLIIMGVTGLFLPLLITSETVFCARASQRRGAGACIFDSASRIRKRNAHWNNAFWAIGGCNIGGIDLNRDRSTFRLGSDMVWTQQ